MNPSPSASEASAHGQNGASTCHSSTYSSVATVSVTVPSRYDARRPTVSATIPVGTSNSTIPAVKNALAANASRFESPASSRKIVLIPQMNDAASVLPSSQEQVGALDGAGGGHCHAYWDRRRRRDSSVAVRLSHQRRALAFAELRQLVADLARRVGCVEGELLRAAEPDVGGEREVADAERLAQERVVERRVVVEVAPERGAHRFDVPRGRGG